MSMCIIGVHGLLSGTASMDFGGKKNVGVAVGIIDGFVYAGTAVMSFTYARILPSDEFVPEGQVLVESADPSAWLAWPWQDELAFHFSNKEPIDLGDAVGVMERLPKEPNAIICSC